MGRAAVARGVPSYVLSLASLACAALAAALVGGSCFGLCGRAGPARLGWSGTLRHAGATQCRFARRHHYPTSKWALLDALRSHGLSQQERTSTKESLHLAYKEEILKWGYRRQWERALAEFAEMEDSGLVHDAVAYNALIRAYGEKVRQWERALAALSEMRAAAEAAAEAERQRRDAEASRQQAELERRRRRESEDLERERVEAEARRQDAGAAPPAKGTDAIVQALVALRKRYKDTDPAGLTTCLQTLRVYINNLARNPHDPKYQRINCDNNAFRSRLAAFEGATAVLIACGFEEEGGALAVGPDFVKTKGSRLWDALTKLDVMIDQVKGSS